MLCLLFLGFPLWSGGVLLQGEEVCDRRGGGGRWLWHKWWWICALRISMHWGGWDSTCNLKGTTKYNFISKQMNVSNLSGFNLLLLRSYCSGVWIPVLFWVDTSLPIMRPLRLIALSHPVNIMYDFVIQGTLSSSVLPREFTYPQFETNTNWSSAGWKRCTFCGIRDGANCCSTTLCLNLN